MTSLTFYCPTNVFEVIVHSFIFLTLIIIIFTPSRHCSYHHHPNLLQEVILAVGYFSVLQTDNQVHTS